MDPTPPAPPRCSLAGECGAGRIHRRAYRPDRGPGPLRGAERRAAVADEVFGARQDGKRVGQVRALEAAHRRASHFLHQLRVFGETFVRAAPTYILRHRDARREHPLDAGGADFLGGDSLHSFHQRGVARASHPDIVREDDRAQDVVVPVHRVDAVQDRNLKPRVGGVPLKPVVEIGPRLQAVAFLGSEEPPLRMEPTKYVSISARSLMCS